MSSSVAARAHGRPGRAPCARKPFLDISDRVATSGPEQGLHSIAFHPQFQKNGRFFVHYNSLPDGQSVIAEFKGSGLQARQQQGDQGLDPDRRPALPQQQRRLDRLRSRRWLPLHPARRRRWHGAGRSAGRRSAARPAPGQGAPHQRRQGQALRHPQRQSLRQEGQDQGLPARDLGPGPARPASVQLRPPDR